MFHRKESVRFGIRQQMAAALLSVFLAGGCILYLGTHARLLQGYEEQISRELLTIRENTGICVRQLLMLGRMNNDEESYRQIAQDIAQELRGTAGTGICVLDRDGGYLAGNLQTKDTDTSGDLQQAIHGNAAFTMTWPDGDTMLVYFSMPVVIEEKTLGIIRYQIDTSRLFLQGKQTERLVCQMAALVFAIVFLLLAFLMSRLLSPVQKLTRISRQVVQDLSREQVDMQMLAQLADSGRRDEIGELSRNFSVMLEMISRQFKNMQEDQKRIVNLLGSRQEFYNNVTHELKTPLTTIQGYAQLMEADQGADTRLTEQGLHHILQESTRMHQMVLQLLEMSDKSIFMKKQIVDLAQTARSTAQALNVKAKRYEMQIQARFPEPLLVLGAEERLRQVLINLLDNAVKYGDRRTAIEFFGYRKDGYVTLAVQNQGKGLSTEDQKRIFEPFYRVDKALSREQGSSGLGLSICRKIMDEQGGTIGVKSGPEGQILFYIRMKAQEEPYEIQKN